jgi:capsular exopolysaccharide synthesis family protein
MSEIVPFQQRGVVEVGTGMPQGFEAGDPSGFEPDGGAQLRNSLAVVWRHRWAVGLAGVVGLLIAAYIVFTQPPVYQAGAVIRLQDKSRAMNPIADEGATPVVGRMADPLYSALEIMRSRNVLGQAVDRGGLRLQGDPGFPWSMVQGVQIDSAATADTLRLRFEAAGYALKSGPREARAAYGQPVSVDGVTLTVVRRPALEQAPLVLLPRELAVYELVGNVHAVPREKTDVVDVIYRAADPYWAQRSLNAIVEAFQAYGARRAQQESRVRRIFVGEQLERTEAQLVQAQDRLSAFRSSEGVYSSAGKATAQQQGLMGLDVRLEDLSAERQTYAALLQRFRQASPAEKDERLRALVAQVGGENPVVGQLYQQLASYQTTRDSLVGGAWGTSTQHPDVVRLDGAIAAAERRLVDAVESQLALMDERLRALSGLAARNQGEMRQLPATEAQEVRLQQEVTSLQQVAEQLRAEYQKAQIAEAVEAGQVDIVDDASFGIPVGAGRMPKLLIGLALGLVFGSAGGFLYEALNTSLRRREDMETLLQVPGLAVIPRITVPAGGAMALGRLRGLLPGRNGAHANGNGNGRLPSAGASLVVVSDSRSSAAEAYRTLRTNLIFSQTGRALRTIVVTSPSPAEGKSTTASNLAVAYAQQGVRVLLMDCDLRRPRMHEIFGLPREPGITQVVVGRRQLADVVRATHIENLWLATTGTLPPNPAEMLGSEVMRRVLAEAASQFDMVVLDTPPVLVASDAAILGSMADGVVLVLRAGRTERIAAQQALKQITTVGGRVLGAALNDPDQKAKRYGAYSYGYDGYGYYGAHDEEEPAGVGAGAGSEAGR